MSQENVEIVRQHYDAFQRRDFNSALEHWDPEGEWIPAMAGAVEGRVYRGLADLQRYFDELFESFSDVRVDDREFRDLDSRVLVLYRLRMRGHDSDLPIDRPAGAVYELRGGKVVRGRSFQSREEALEAVRLRE